MLKRASETLIRRDAGSYILLAAVVCACVILFSAHSASAQRLILIDSFAGGICTDGFATDGQDTRNPGQLELEIPSSATLRKVLMVAGSHGNASVQIQFDGAPINFDASTLFTGPFFSRYGTGFVHVKDITSTFDPKRKLHSLAIPSQSYPSSRFNEFYVIVLYNEPAFPEIHVSVYANTKDFSPSISYQVPQRRVEKPYVFAVMGGYYCDRGDGESVEVNAVTLGILDTNDKNSGTCGGPVGSFHFAKGVLTGIGDDTPDNKMGDNDALADISGLLALNGKTISIKFNHRPSSSEDDNSVWAFLLVTGKPCPTGGSRSDTTICEGASLELTAGKDTSKFELGWYSLPEHNHLDGEAPIVSPTQATRYVAQTLSLEGCTSFDTVAVAVTQQGSSRDLNVCLGGTFELRPLADTSTNSVSWLDVGTSSILPGKTPTITAMKDGLYIALIQGSNICTTRDTVMVHTITSGKKRSTSVCLGSRFQLIPLLDTLSFTHEWFDVTTNTSLFGQAPFVTIDRSFTFIDKIRDRDGCITFDTLLVVGSAHRTLTARFEDPVFEFDDQQGQISLLVSSDPPMNVISGKKLLLLIRPNDELIRLGTAAASDPKLTVSLQQQQEGYYVQIDIPDGYGGFSTARIVLNGNSFLSSVERDSCSLVTFEDKAPETCLDLIAGEKTITQRVPHCGDLTLRDLLSFTTPLRIEPIDQGLQLTSDRKFEKGIDLLVTDLLGRSLIEVHVDHFPARIDIPKGRSRPLFVRSMEEGRIVSVVVVH